MTLEYNDCAERRKVPAQGPEAERLKSGGAAERSSGAITKNPRILIFIVAYNAEKTIDQVLTRIPAELKRYDIEILIIDDASCDATFQKAEEARAAGLVPFPLTVLQNPENQMYGGNQKIGFHYAVEKGFDIVVLLHGDGQYAPEALPDLLEPLVCRQADAVFGSRMMTVLGALKGGMPLYKYVGNRILTAYQNLMLGTSFFEFHSGYRLYTTEALRKVPFHLNTNDFHFDTEIIVQLVMSRQRVKEIPIPTRYGDEICHVNGLKYAWNVVVATTVAWLQSFCLVYRRNFDVKVGQEDSWAYRPKLHFDSSHSKAVALVRPGSKVVIVGAEAVYLSEALRGKGCYVVGVDWDCPDNRGSFDEVHACDLNGPLPDSVTADADYILLLDVIEHLQSPERFMENLSSSLAYNRQARLLVSTGNVGFVVPRLMLLAGQFNYGRKGILDLTHTRLFTYSSLKRIGQESGFKLVADYGVPVPFPLVLRQGQLARTMMSINRWLIAVYPTLFSYQIFLELKPLPNLESLLADTLMHSHRLRESQPHEAVPRNLALPSVARR